MRALLKRLHTVIFILWIVVCLGFGAYYSFHLIQYRKFACASEDAVKATLNKFGLINKDGVDISGYSPPEGANSEELVSFNNTGYTAREIQAVDAGELTIEAIDAANTMKRCQVLYKYAEGVHRGWWPLLVPPAAILFYMLLYATVCFILTGNFKFELALPRPNVKDES